ncbi:malonate transporter subunit MadM [bacterium M00.F.Ca.ET.228.01.1.1]|uniref:Malonate transporter, MadM subunit n=1 Tax=Burkholderia sp. (strain CCGE1003) TaxID=640512 RepID=E1T5H0_BURSG|nr:malonate transporter subunit MadM [Paraburkholderia phenoliruptrix]MBW9129820.1 malonate transporter subunit MadM [Paraburkholderia ginsengiterrae]TGP42630.1 malonate transporter subunit MadM [bacterium M00.F.Ca.ET.228.01.1.1]TGR95355.1 malonate transporter subunit MadM [bacterium M00.F.Ca.ET.191.01.1.1]TGT96244.1 malonate transporter subunit MadM [bacterium M00.F.Ca.ET.155.01.1.1]MBW0447665.1 malonate transporter subunit MadM [Paraburkholderia phenoliruptrix]
MLQMLDKVLIHNGLVTAFALVGLIMWVSSQISRKLTFGRVHGSAIAILIGLVLAYLGGAFTAGQKGLADLPLFAGVGLMGGAMLRDFAIVATAFEVQATEARKAGLIGVVSLLLGTVLPFIVGASIAHAFGYTDAVSMTTIGAGAVTYIVGPVTGAAIGASSDVIALSIATGLIKAIIVMVGTPLAAGFMGLKTPRSAMIFGGLAGTVSGVSAGLAATDRRLVPYGALIATFHTGVGCLLGPSLLFFTTRALVGG